MDIKEFSRQLHEKTREIEQLMRRKMPTIVGAMAKSHFRENFRKGGFVNNGLQKWAPSKRIGMDTGAASKYGTLLSSRMHLYNNVAYVPGDGRVRIHIPVPYASAHQFGETITVPVTPKMRGYAWRQYYKLSKADKAGGKGQKKGNMAVSAEAGKWKGLALTKKTQLRIKMPRRPMIGESTELTEKYNARLESELTKILNQ